MNTTDQLAMVFEGVQLAARRLEARDDPDARKGYEVARRLWSGKVTKLIQRPDATPLGVLVARAGLDETDVTIVTALVAHTMEPSVGARLGDDVTLTAFVTTLGQDLEERRGLMARLAQGRPLVASRVVRVSPEGAVLSLSRAALAHLLGLPPLDGSLEGIARHLAVGTTTPPLGLTGPQEQALEAIRLVCRGAQGSARPGKGEPLDTVALCVTPSRQAAVDLGAWMAGEPSRGVVVVDGKVLASLADTGRRRALEEAVLAQTLAGGSLVVDLTAAAHLAEAEVITLVVEVVAERPVPVIVATTSRALARGPLREGCAVALDLGAETAEQRLVAWERYLSDELPLGEDVDVLGLSRRVPRTSRGIRNAVGLSQALAELRGEATISHQLLSDAARIAGGVLGDEHRGSGEPRIVLTEEGGAQLERIHTAVESLRTVGALDDAASSVEGGLTVLLDGPSGTGKSLTATVIAGRAGMELVPITPGADGSLLASIEDAFATARATGAAVLLDNADRLFPRTEEDARVQDKTTARELNALATLREEFDGLVIVVVERFGALDESLRAVIDYRLTFVLPDTAMRAELWEARFPRGLARGGDIDFDVLARDFELSGRSIEKAIRRAAHLAALEGDVVRQRHLEAQALVEAQAVGAVYRLSSAMGTSPRDVIRFELDDRIVLMPREVYEDKVAKGEIKPRRE